MEYRVLGKTGLRVSRLGFGGIPIQKTDPEQTKQLIHYLMDQGINFIDTARAYTVSEEYLGYALEGIRDQFVLASKSMARTKEAMQRDIATSLANLRTNYIDLYQVHNPSAADLETVMAPGGALEALLEAKEKGLIGHIGITEHSTALFEKALDLEWVETVMFPFNIVEEQAQALIDACHEKNIGFIDMKPLAGGAIDDASAALRYIAAKKSVDVIIPGMATVEEIQENIASTCDASPLTPEELSRIDEIRKLLTGNFCRRCGYCAPCTVGINIPILLQTEAYYSRYGLKKWALDRYASTEHKAGACIECGLCESRCPYNLPIRQMLKKAKEIFGG